VLLAALVASMALSAPGCGKKGVPMPPLRVRPVAASGLQIHQRGDRLILSLPEPKKRTDGTDLGGDALLRLTLAPEGQTEAPKGRVRRSGGASGRGARPVSWVIPRADWPRYRQEGRLEIPISIGSLEMKPPPDTTSLAGKKASFVAEVQEGPSDRSAPAPAVTITICEPPPPPSGVEARPSSAGMSLWWRSEKPGEVHLYRAPGDAAYGEKPYKVLPPSTDTWLDPISVSGTRYRYRIRLGAGSDPRKCESESSEEVVATWVDLFPPEPPAELAAAAEEDLIRLFWTPGAEPDLAGYIVYRSDGPDEPFRVLTPTPIPTSTYADTDVEHGRRYTYVVTAVDGAQPPNQSGWSRPAVERMP
jgi:hypothetical protein